MISVPSVMEESRCIKVDIQVAARDADTRTLVGQLGKRHKWCAANISTDRHLSCVASFVLRHLGIDANHQVILYPDSSVHTHLQNTPVNWGPTYDRAVPLKDIRKIFGSPSKLHFLYHIITPETLSPPSKRKCTEETRQNHTVGDVEEQQLLQPRRINFLQELDAKRLQQQQHQLQQQPQLQQTGAQAHQLQQNHQAVASSAWSQPVCSMACPWPVQHSHLVQQFQDQHQQLCQPLLVAKQQLPLQQLQHNAQLGYGCCHPQYLSACRQSLDNGWQAPAADSSHHMMTSQQNMHLILQQPSSAAGQQQQQQRCSAIPGAFAPQQTALEHQQQLQGGSSQQQQQQQGAAQQGSAWQTNSLQQIHQVHLAGTQFGTLPPGSVMQQGAIHGPGQLRHVPHGQQGQGQVLMGLTPQQQQQQQQHKEARQLLAGGQLTFHPQQLQHHPVASCQPEHGSQGRAAVYPPGDLTGSALVCSVSHQSSQHTSGQEQLQQQQQQMQQQEHQHQQNLRGGQHQLQPQHHGAPGVAAGPQNPAETASGHEEHQQRLQQAAAHALFPAGCLQQQYEQQGSVSSVIVAADGAAGVHLLQQQQQAAELSLQPVAPLQQAQDVQQPTPPPAAAQHQTLATQSATPSAEVAPGNVAPGNASVRLTLRTLDGESIDLPFSYSTDNGRLVLIPQSQSQSCQGGTASVMPSAAHLLALLGAADVNSPIPPQPGGADGAQAGVQTAAAGSAAGICTGVNHQKQYPGLAASSGSMMDGSPEYHLLSSQQQEQQPHAQQQQYPQFPEQQQRQLQQQAVHSHHQQQVQLMIHGHSQDQLQQRGVTSAGAPTEPTAGVAGGGLLSVSAAPVSSVNRVIQSGAHSSAGRAPHATCHDSLTAGLAASPGPLAASPGDVRSHCSSVSCGAGAAAAGAAAGGPDGRRPHSSGRLAAAEHGSVDLNTRVPDAGGSATRSSVPRRDLELEVSGGAASSSQQQKQVQQQLAGRGVLQPRQLQLQQQPHISHQQQWQPQLQSIAEQHEATGAPDVSSHHFDASGTPPLTAADSSLDVSGALDLQLEDSGLEQQHAGQEEEVLGGSYLLDATQQVNASQQVDDNAADAGGLVQVYMNEGDASQHSQQQGLQTLSQQEKSRLQGTQPQPGQDQLIEQPQQQQQQQGSHLTQGQQQQCSQQYSGQRSQQQCSESQDHSHPQAHSRLQPHHQEQQHQQQQQQQSTSHLHCSMLDAPSHPACQRPSKAIKRPLAEAGQSLLNAIGASSAVVVSMQPPSKRFASARNTGRASAQLLQQLPTSMRLPAEDSLMMPSIVSKGSSFAGTWHRSTGCWDSRVQQTPLRAEELAAGGIFSVAELLRQQKQKQQEQQLGGGGRGIGRSGIPSQDSVDKAARANRSLQQQQQQQPLQCAAGMHKSGARSKQGQPAHSHGEVSVGPTSNPGSTSLQGWCGAPDAAGAAVSTGGGGGSAVGGSSAAGASAVSEQGEEVSGALTKPEHDAAAVVRDPVQASQAVQQQQQPASQSGVKDDAEVWLPDTGPLAVQSQQQQHHKLAPASWQGFQAAGSPADGERARRTPETFTEQQQQMEEADAAATADGQRAAADMGNNNDSMFIDLEGIAAVLNGQSLMDVQQANQLAAQQQPQGASGQVPAAGAGVPMTMHDALKAAGIVPPSPEPSHPQPLTATTAAAGDGLLSVSGSAAIPDPCEQQQQHIEELPLQDKACRPLPVSAGAAVAVDGLLLCELDDDAPAAAAAAAQDIGQHCSQNLLMPGAAGMDPAAIAAPGMVTIRCAAAATASGGSPGSSSPDSWCVGSEGGSGGDGTATSDKGASRQQGSSSNNRKRGAARVSKPAVKCRAPPPCRAPLPSVQQAMLPGPAGNRQEIIIKPSSRVPLPPATALPPVTGTGRPRGPSRKALRKSMPVPAGPGIAVAAAAAAKALPPAANGALQRFALPNGQTVYVAAAKPGLQTATGPGRLQAQPLLPQQQLQPANEQLLHQQLLQQQLLQLTLLQQQQQQQQMLLQAGDIAATAGLESAVLDTSAAAAAPLIGPQDASAVATAACPAAAELAAAVNRLGHGSTGSLPGIITPGFLSPTGLLSPTAGPGCAGGVGLGGASATLDSLEALLADKDFGFFSPEKGNPLLLFNNNSTLAGMMSCLSSPSLQQMHLSPLPLAKRPRAPSTQQQQQQGTGALSGKTSPDLQSLFHTFRDSGGDAATQVAAAAENGSKAQTRTAGAPTAADAGSGPADQQQLQGVVAGDDGQVGELYQYLMGAGGDSWLGPPAGAGAGAGAAPPAGCVDAGGLAGPAEQRRPDAAVVTHQGCSGATACSKGAQEIAAPKDVNAMSSGSAAVAATHETKRKRSAALVGRRGPGLARQQRQPRTRQGPSASGFNPDKPFAALFPGAAS